jgi:hypothetical protein
MDYSIKIAWAEKVRKAARRVNERCQGFDIF